ncbi:MAG: Zinc phosphodiesterase ELAC protein 2 [Icmadophila ericetorum]|nr:Zinc phosphodiesterase ELAC protein 2 [Icmadophila ericetorum]
MKSFAQIISTPTSDTLGTTLVLHFDNKRYLIGNLHEGLQRTSIERGTRLIKVADVFLTGKTEWKNTGGMIGMILTLADVASVSAAATTEYWTKKQTKRAQLQSEDGPGIGSRDSVITPAKPFLKIHGGPNITHTLATARRFVFRKGTPVEINEFKERQSNQQWEPNWRDENIQVWAMPIGPLESNNKLSFRKRQSPRKRSLDDYQEDLIHSPRTDDRGPNESNMSEEDIRNEEIRREVISDMFGSNWRLDALVEMPIASVKMPATLFTRDTITKKLANYTGPMPGGNQALPDINVLVRKPWPASQIAELPPTKPSSIAMSYIIRNYPQRGKFDPEKAVALGVAKGPQFRQLVNGESVITKNGHTVLPEQVMGETKPGAGFAVVELPSRDYVEPLVKRPEWTAPEVIEAVNSIVWNLGPGVTSDPTLRAFMIQHPHIKHIVSSPDHCSDSLSMGSAAAAAIRLNQIDPERFIIPIHNNTETPISTDTPYATDSQPVCIIAKIGMKIHLEPTSLVDESTAEPSLNTASVIEATPKNVLLLANAIRQEINSKNIQKELSRQNLPSPDAEIVCLGTGSALPSKYRNVSATLLRVPGCGSYLLDCGENTLGQLRRIYGPEEMLEVLRDLKMIWISHLHADHHLGTASVIKAWYEAIYGGSDEDNGSMNQEIEDPTPGSLTRAFNDHKRLCIVSEIAYLKWLKDYSSAEDFGYKKIIPLAVWGVLEDRKYSTEIKCNGIKVGFNTSDPQMNSGLKAVTGLSNLDAANVSHCHGAKAVSLTFPTGFKFSYSGDCRPSVGFTQIGKNSTVLLHEATFDDELAGDAVAKKHCTTSEAIGVGVAMGARRILLTHFSQRYQKIAMMDGIEGHELPLKFEDADPNADAENTNMPLEGVPETETIPLSELVENDASMEDMLGTSTPPSRNSESRLASSPPKTITQRVDLSALRKRDMKVGVCFDYMRVKVKDIALLEKITPALIKLYENEPELAEKSVASVEDKDEEEAGKQGTVNGNVEDGKGLSKAEKKKKRMGGGKMGRTEISEEERKAVRSGGRLFS